ncbi:MAG: RHS repeat-associated core domain-containing protein [Anaerolineae bacterium]
MTIGVGTTTSNTCFELEYTGSLYLDGPIGDGAYKEERPAGTTSDARVIGKYYEYDHALNRQTKRYYAEGKLLATRMTIFGCPPVGTCDALTYVQSDHLGSTSTLTDTSGKVVGRERYSAFGERRRGETPPTTDRLYTGQRLNLIGNLYHYTDGTSAGRFYDPVLARFIQPDSVTPGKGSQTLNRYAYSVNNPVRYTDPTGHAFKDDNPGGEWGSPIAVDAVYDDRNFDLFMQAYGDYNVEYDPVLNNIEQTPWAYLSQAPPLPSTTACPTLTTSPTTRPAVIASDSPSRGVNFRSMVYHHLRQ